MPLKVRSAKQTAEYLLNREFGKSEVTPEMIHGAILSIHKVRRDLADYYREKMKKRLKGKFKMEER